MQVEQVVAEVAQRNSAGGKKDDVGGRGDRFKRGLENGCEGRSTTGGGRTRSIRDGDGVRIKKKGTGFPIGSGGVHRSIKIQFFFSGNFNKSSVTKIFSSSSLYKTKKSHSPIGPENDLSTITVCHSIGKGLGIGSDIGVGRIGNRALALIVATKKERSSTQIAREINKAITIKTQHFAKNMNDTSRFALTIPRGIQCARNTDFASLPTHEDDLSVFFNHRTRLDDAIHIDHPVNNILSGIDIHPNHPTISKDASTVRDQGS